MKKAEAISILATSVRPREAKDRARYDEAVRMAIEALSCSEIPNSSEQNAETAQTDHNADIGKKVEQTVETAQNVQNGDLISRKWLVECIEEGWVKFDTAKDCNRMMHLVRDIAPSVQPERKPGHWLKISPAGIYECSKCGKNVMTADIDAYEFCHGCGCRMMEVEHEKKT